MKLLPQLLRPDRFRLSPRRNPTQEQVRCIKRNKTGKLQYRNGSLSFHAGKTFFKSFKQLTVNGVIGLNGNALSNAGREYKLETEPKLLNNPTVEVAKD